MVKKKNPPDWAVFFAARLGLANRYCAAIFFTLLLRRARPLRRDNLIRAAKGTSQGLERSVP